MYGDEKNALQAKSSEPRNITTQHGIHARIESAIQSYERQSKRASAAFRAKQIIEQHPEFAELLDLLHEF